MPTGAAMPGRVFLGGGGGKEMRLIPCVIYLFIYLGGGGGGGEGGGQPHFPISPIRLEILGVSSE